MRTWGAGSSERPPPPPMPSGLRLPQTHLTGENSWRGEEDAWPHPCSALLQPHPGYGGCLALEGPFGGGPQPGFVPGGLRGVGNHVAQGPGALREAKVEAPGGGACAGQLPSRLGGSSAGVELRIGPPNQLPRGGFPAGVGRRAAGGGTPSRHPSPEQMVPRQQAAPSASITRAGRLTIAFRG